MEGANISNKNERKRYISHLGKSSPFFASGRTLVPFRIYQLGGMPFGRGDASDFLPIAVKGDCLAQAVPLLKCEGVMGWNHSAIKSTSFSGWHQMQVANNSTVEVFLFHLLNSK